MTYLSIDISYLDEEHCSELTLIQFVFLIKFVNADVVELHQKNF